MPARRFGLFRLYRFCRLGKKDARLSRGDAHVSNVPTWVRRSDGDLCPGCLLERLHQFPRLHPQRLQGGAELLPARRPGGRALDRRRRHPAAKADPESSAAGGRSSTTRSSTTWFAAPIGRTSRCGRRASACSRPGPSWPSPWATSFRSSKTPSGRLPAAVAVAPSRRPGVLDSWNYGFNLQWELDFWGRFRRAIAAADDNLDASVADYDGVLVTMLGDIAQNYVQVRTDQERIKTAASQRGTAAGSLAVHRHAAEGRLPADRVGLGPGR